MALHWRDDEASEPIAPSQERAFAIPAPAAVPLLLKLHAIRGMRVHLHENGSDSSEIMLRVDDSDLLQSMKVEMWRVTAGSAALAVTLSGSRETTQHDEQIEVDLPILHVSMPRSDIVIEDCDDVIVDSFRCERLAAGVGAGARLELRLAFVDPQPRLVIELAPYSRLVIDDGYRLRTVAGEGTDRGRPAEMVVVRTTAEGSVDRVSLWGLEHLAAATEFRENCERSLVSDAVRFAI